MVSADDIARSIEPGSTEYGDRQVVEDRIRQVSAQAQAAPPTRDGSRARSALDKTLGGPVSDQPITAGLSLGPGAGPSRQPVVAGPRIEKLRILAQEARSPRLRALARDLLRAEARRVT